MAFNQVYSDNIQKAFPAVTWPVDEQEAIRVAKREECRIWLIQQQLLAS